MFICNICTYEHTLDEGCAPFLSASAYPYVRPFASGRCGKCIFFALRKKSEERAYIKKQKQKQKQFRNYSTTVVDLLPFRFSFVLLLRVCTLSSAAFDFYTCSSLSGYIIYMSRLRIWLLSRET